MEEGRQCQFITHTLKNVLVRSFKVWTRWNAVWPLLLVQMLLISQFRISPIHSRKSLETIYTRSPACTCISAGHYMWWVTLTYTFFVKASPMCRLKVVLLSQTTFTWSVWLKHPTPYISLVNFCWYRKSLSVNERWIRWMHSITITRKGCACSPWRKSWCTHSCWSYACHDYGLKWHDTGKLGGLVGTDFLGVRLWFLPVFSPLFT